MWVGGEAEAPLTSSPPPHLWPTSSPGPGATCKGRPPSPIATTQPRSPSPRKERRKAWPGFRSPSGVELTSQGCPWGT